MPWFDFRPDATWVSNILSVQEWATSRWNRCELFKLLGVTILSLYPDWMHDKNLGSDKVAYLAYKEGMGMGLI